MAREIGGMSNREEKQKGTRLGDGEITDCSCGTSEQPGLSSALVRRRQVPHFFRTPASPSRLDVQRLPNKFLVESRKSFRTKKS